MKTVLIALTIFAVQLLAYAGNVEEMFKGAERLETTSETSGIHHYRLSNGKVVTFGSEIIVKVAKEETVSHLNKLYQPMSLEFLSDTLILMTFKRGVQPLQLSKEISGEKGVLFAHPNLHTEKQLR